MTDRVYEPPVDELAKKPAAARLQFQAFSLIFFVSGGTSLVYQVAWVRELSLFFGSDVYSAAITLASEIDGFNGWALLDSVLRYAAERVPAAARVSNHELARAAEPTGRLRTVLER